MIPRRYALHRWRDRIALLGLWLWTSRGASDPPQGFAKTNGRIEAERIDIATKFAGRPESVSVKEGDVVTAGTGARDARYRRDRRPLKEAEAASGGPISSSINPSRSWPNATAS
jgi:hypothetical protein